MIKKTTLALLTFLFIFSFFVNFTNKDLLNNELQEQTKLFNFYSKLYSKIATPEIIQKILFYSQKYNLNPQETFAFIYCESRFNATAMGYNFAYNNTYDIDGNILYTEKKIISVDIGLCQISNIYHYVKNPFNLDVNLSTGLSYFKSCMEKSDNDFRLALFRYNAGDWNCDHNNMPYITYIYIQRVLSEKVKIIFET